MTTITDDPILLAAIRRDRRERIATAVMASMGTTSAFDDYINTAKWAPDEDLLTAAQYHAELAVEWADALIAELDKVAK